jgi:hypothetical protein
LARDIDVDRDRNVLRDQDLPAVAHRDAQRVAARAVGGRDGETVEARRLARERFDDRSTSDLEIEGSVGGEAARVAELEDRRNVPRGVRVRVGRAEAHPAGLGRGLAQDGRRHRPLDVENTPEVQCACAELSVESNEPFRETCAGLQEQE